MNISNMASIFPDFRNNRLKRFCLWYSVPYPTFISCGLPMQVYAFLMQLSILLVYCKAFYFSYCFQGSWQSFLTLYTDFQSLTADSWQFLKNCCLSSWLNFKASGTSGMLYTWYISLKAPITSSSSHYSWPYV
jgi:hypothetical protein